MKNANAAAQGCTHFKLRQLLRSVSRLYDAEIAKAGLKSTQFSLLSHLRAAEPVSPSALAARMGLDASTLTRNLRPLLDAGWVRQDPGADARGRLIRTTPEGQARHALARVHWKRAQQALGDVVGADEIASIHAMIDRTQQVLDSAAAPSKR